MRNAERIYRIANSHAQTVQVCIDRLHQFRANQQLNRLAERLQKLATQAAPGDGEKSERQQRRAKPRRGGGDSELRTRKRDFHRAS
jgi:hypothetical protein